MTVPRRLYKYRSLSLQTIELLVEDKVYFAEPRTFNDPMDTKPTVEPDLDVPELEDVLERLTVNRTLAEMTAAARSIRYKGPRTTEHIQRNTLREARRLLDTIAYQATDPEFAEPPPMPHKRLLSMHIEEELLRQYEKGVFALAARYNCPLMWSHYGDQHRGVCIGYSVPPGFSETLHKVTYGGSRLVRASRIKAMLDGDEEAMREVDEGVLLKKARDWRYEKEWRALGEKGLRTSPFELEEVILGSRCTWPITHAVRKALEGREREVELYRMREVAGEFKLRRYRLTAEDYYSAPIRALTGQEIFEVLPDS